MKRKHNISMLISKEKKSKSNIEVKKIREKGASLDNLSFHTYTFLQFLYDQVLSFQNLNR